MKAFGSKVLARLVFFLVAAFGFEPSRAAAPVYYPIASFTNVWFGVKALNNAGDILVSDSRTSFGAGGERFAIVGGGREVQLNVLTDPSVTRAWAVAMSERTEDGHVFVAGTAACTDGLSRGCVWKVAPDGTFTFHLAQNMKLASGQEVDSEGFAINREGVLLGQVSPSLANARVCWRPPYDVAERIVPTSMVVSIDDLGNMLANGVEFGRGTAQHHEAAALLSADGSVTEIPRLDPGTPYVPPFLPPPFPGQISNYNRALMKRGEWVVGSSPVDGPDRPFAWRVGTANAIRLPSDAERAHAVNASGQALGNHTFWKSPILWQRENDVYVAYDLFRLIPADSFYPNVVESSWLNDSGQIVVEYRDTQVYPAETVVRLYGPLTNGAVVRFRDPWTPGYESKAPGETNTNSTAGTMRFAIELTRAGYTGPVTVNYRTVDGSAKEGVNYVGGEGSVSWAAREVGNKVVRIDLIDNLLFDTGKTFQLELTSAAGAELPLVRTLTGHLYDGSFSITAQNWVFLTNGESGVFAVRGATQALVNLQRYWESDGKVIVTNFTTTDITAMKGLDYLLPAGLSATWEAGQTGVVTIAIPLLQRPSVSSYQMFTVQADVLVEGSEYRDQTYFRVLILPSESALAYRFWGTELKDGKLRTTAAVLQGSIVEVLKAPTLEGPWSLHGRASGTNGKVVLEAPATSGEAKQFFRLRRL